MKNERLQRWISRINGAPQGPGEGVPPDEAGGEVPGVDEVPGTGRPSPLQRIQDQVMTTRSLGIIALVVFAPVVMLVIFKVLRDIRSSLG